MAVNLGGLVSDSAAELYRRLVVDGPIPLESAEALAELDAAGLITRSPCHPGMAVAVAPEVACDELVARFSAELAERHARLRAALAEVAVHRSRADGRVELLTDANAIKYTATGVLAGARAEACEFAVATHDPALTSVDLPLEPDTAPGVRYRVVYTSECLKSALGRQIIEASRAAEEQRFFSGALTSLRIADDDVALVRVDGGALHVRSRPLVALVQAWFDLVWERSAPPEDDGVRLTARELAVLEMQAAGNKDAAIARALGVNVRTVRRHVASILDQLGVESRFAAGVEAVRRGLLFREGRDGPHGTSCQ